MKKVFAEYFAGIGLVRMGLEICGWKVAFSNDISLKKFEMYRDFFPDADAHYIVGDVYNLKASDIPLTTLATCSFPCIDLSLAGNMNGISGEHSSAFWGFVKILDAQGELAPPLVLVENVPGWLVSNQGNDFRLTVQALNNIGYQCDVFALDARHFTPQSRLRIFLIGIKANVENQGIQKMFSRDPVLLPDALRKCLFQNSDLKWFYWDIPHPPEIKNDGLSQIIENLSDNDERWWSQNEIDYHLQMMDESHRQRVLFLMDSNEYSYRTFYRRRRSGSLRAEVRKDDLAGCLRTAIGGSGKQFLIKVGKGNIKMRTMTPREYARLQGTPDFYPIKVSDTQALTGFGDAVCVPAITWIGDNILNPLLMKYFPEEVYLLREYARQSNT